MTVAISPDGGKSWPWQRHLDEGDGYCMTNNSQEKLNREFSYPSIKQGADGSLHIAYRISARRLNTCAYHRNGLRSQCDFWQS
jgi:predicted neuraminidase